jgi:hypothetical protein
MGDMQFNGTQEEWDALVNQNAEKLINCQKFETLQVTFCK